MKTPALLICLGAVVAPTASAQTTAYTAPSGYVKLDIPAAISASEPSLSAISVTLLGEVAYSGPAVVDAFANGEQTIQLPGLNLASAAWVTSGEPHVAYLKTAEVPASGGNPAIPAGEEPFPITAIGGSGAGTPASDELRIQVEGDLSGLNFPASNTITIRKATTISSVFGKESSLITGNDRLFVWAENTWNQLQHFPNSGWFNISQGFAEANDMILFSSEGILVSRAASTPTTLTIFGDVPTTPQVTTIPGNGLSFISGRFPVTDQTAPTTLSDMKINELPSWGDDDRVFMRANGEWNSHIFFGNAWFNESDGFSSSDSEAIPPNSALFVSRSGNSSADTEKITLDLPYTID